ETNEVISSASLPKLLGVNERTVRNYISKLMNSGYKIESSRSGYRLLSDDSSKSDTPSVNRVNYVLSRLLCERDGVSVFDIAEELNVSDSTVVNTIIPEIKDLAFSYNLKVESRNYTYFLSGKEKDKRKLIGYIATNNATGFFSSVESLSNFFSDVRIKEISEEIYRICNNSSLFINNYALNNLLVHILIILLRLESDNTLATTPTHDGVYKLIESSDKKEDILKLTEELSDFFKSRCNKSLPDYDMQQIIALIILSTDHSTKSSVLFDEEFRDYVIRSLNNLSSKYNLPLFDDNFTSQFVLHMYNVKLRSEFNLSYPNPISPQIKKDYALVYDMAVYFSHEFSSHFNIKLNEDEIAFIALHIGSYLESSKGKENVVSSIIIIDNYHDISKQLANTIQKKFDDELLILDVMTADEYMLYNPICDLIITTTSLNISHKHIVLINPILTKTNIIDIYAEIEHINYVNSSHEVKQALASLFNKDLYIRNLPAKTREECIRYICDECCKLGYVDNNFVDDVLLRESMSSTAFTDFFAIPHSINVSALKSFIYIVHNDFPISWGNKNVNIILLIGITEDDLKRFNYAFDLIIDSFTNKASIIKILESDSFEEFVSNMINL
ncbi:MAG: PTS sugar transporter subunit IIA, partial [Erysipelotrichaceae bacterium]|nr:PTS sugar transporter subunit IIA [Erysipelotrichaceae bacterium]